MQWWVMACLGVAALLLISSLYYAWSHRGHAHQKLDSDFEQPAPAITTLTRHDGEPFDLEELRGKVVLMTFGFTHCPNICPMTLGSLAAVKRELTPEEADDLEVVFITVDPQRDTVETLAGYVPFFEENFIGLTGDREAIDDVVKRYGAVYEKVPMLGSDASSTYTVDHSAYIYLIDPQGMWTDLIRHEEVMDTAGVVEKVREHLPAS